MDIDWTLAENVAKALSGRGTDPNEVSKLLAYVRSQALSGSDAGKRMFVMLDTMVRDGRHLARSGRTIDYYRDMRDVCATHLQAYKQATGDRAWELARILAWAVRLMRYYATDEGRAEVSARQSRRSPARTGQEPATRPQPQRVSGRATTARTVAVEQVTLLGAPAGGRAQVRTEHGETVQCTMLPRINKGERVLARVTREGKRAVSAEFSDWVA